MASGLIRIGIINYQGALKSSVYGLEEMFLIANKISVAKQNEQLFSIKQITSDQIAGMVVEQGSCLAQLQYEAIIIPPSIELEHCLNTDPAIKDWILGQHKLGSIICSACAGIFVLATTGLLKKRIATTHWDLALQFSKKHPDVILDVEKILLNDGDIITAGGLMSWIDLGLELVAQFSHLDLLRQLGKHLIIDTGLREQRYYQNFSPKWDHGDSLILKAQHYMQAHFNQAIHVTSLAELCFLSQRTFLRRFVKATSLKPMQYLQKLRIQKASELIETTKHTFDTISHKVGYEDISAFRRVFIKMTGLTPKEFRRRLSRSLD